MNNQLNNERAILQQIAAGDENAFRTLFYHYGPIIHRFVLNIIKNEAVAKEIVQEVFLRVWLKKETLPAIDQPASWLYRIGSNLALTHFRRQQMERKIVQSIQENQEEEPPAIDLKELQALIGQAVNQLPAQRQRIFRMSREQGLSRKEIAAALHISENTVRNQLAISLQTIQQFIESSSGYTIPVLLILAVLPV
ncbi:MAG: RNA polymerase sigma-70 factor [Candidatus Pseudobacter hemicellulosilyticus]|uniref:RNA polymerase sigma-70 factor n=1 Tax=Candidatus Pseudobacter hemicellulosilyticus TaxID=3121375 RepID=A0AAJ5WRZ5_9BACT|nr:MAG: RNA polymerase sigma-70 factor [Pseudobacter sp.]